MNRSLWLTVLEFGKSNIKMLVSGEGLDASSHGGSRMMRESKRRAKITFLKALVSPVRVELLWPTHLLKVPPLHIVIRAINFKISFRETHSNYSRYLSHTVVTTG